MALIAFHFKAGVILVVDGVAIGIIITSLFPTSIPPPPFSPSLINLMVSVDVKHHVYFYSFNDSEEGCGPQLRLKHPRNFRPPL